MRNLRTREIDEQTASPAQRETLPAPMVAPHPKGRRGLTVVREPDETDAAYAARCEFVVMLIDAVEKG